MVAKRFLATYCESVNLTIKSLPDELGAALKKAAATSHRSLNGEIIHRLENSFGVREGPVVRDSPDEVANAWAALAGLWNSDLSVDAEIASLYERRSASRDVDVSW